MTDTAIERSGSGAGADAVLEKLLLAAVALALLLKLHLVFVTNVNWDEFFYLSKVHDYLRGTLAIPLQTFHVHAFAWLPLVSENEVDQVIAARLAVYGLGLASALMIYRIGRRYLDRLPVLFGLLCYLSFSYVIEHGTSFRFDPIAAFLFLASVALLLELSPRWLAAGGAAVAIAAALMITIKSVFYLPVLGLLLLGPLLRRETRVEGLKAAAVFALTLAVGFAALYLLHRAALNVPAPQDGAAFAGRAADKVIRHGAFFPSLPYFVHGLIENVVVWGCLVWGAVALAGSALQRDGREAAKPATLLVFLVPLLSLLVYRNAFPYFYVFLLPLACLVCGVAFGALLRLRPGRLLRSPELIAFGLVVAIGVSFGKIYLGVAAQSTQVQRETIALVHRLFPEPVPYIDRCSMIASFPKVGFFMSSWGMEVYRDAGRPVFRELIRREHPPFLIANTRSLDPSLSQEALRARGGLTLLEEDFAVLGETYVHHWGLLYVAGKRLDLSAGAPVDFEILIPGRYTLEAAGEVTIDGQRYAAGSTLALAAGSHSAQAIEPGTGGIGAGEVILRWGENLYVPPDPPPPGWIFAGF